MDMGKCVPGVFSTTGEYNTQQNGLNQMLVYGMDSQFVDDDDN
jgi:hypothetical protein